MDQGFVAAGTRRPGAKTSRVCRIARTSVDRRWVLCICLLFTCHAGRADEPIGVDLDDAPPQSAAPEATVETVERELLAGPFEVVPLLRFGSDIEKLERLGKVTERLTAGTDWAKNNELILMDIVESLGSIKGEVEWTSARRVIEYEMGLVVPAFQPDDSELMVVIAFPATLGSVQKILGEEAFNDFSEPDEDGFVRSQATDILILPGDDYQMVSFMDTSRITPDAVGADLRKMMTGARERIRSSPPTEVVELTLEPRRIRNGLKNPFLKGILAGLLTDTQQRDDEDPLSYRLRETWGKSTASALDLLFNQIESITYTLRFDEQTEAISVSLDITAVEQSDFDSWIDRQRDSVATAIRWLHPQQDAFLSLSLVLPEQFQTMLPLLADAFADALLEEQTVSAGSAKQIRTAAQDMAKSGTLELLLQWIPGTTHGLETASGLEQAHSLAATIPFPEPLDLTSTAIELVSAANDPAWHIAVADIDGWPVHRYQSLGQVAGGLAGVDTWIAPTDRQITVMQGGPDAAALLASIVKREHDDVGELDDVTRYRRNALACQVRLCQLFLAFYKGNDDAVKQLVPALHHTPIDAVRDNVTVLLHTPPHHVRVEANFDQHVVLTGIQVFEGLFVGLAEGIDF
ncbi:MAG: hypothetical protein KDA96_19020 [Planctomycetaceae bacterium]|nr:hypothetical protein [Planctomycetaceae bacterium]